MFGFGRKYLLDKIGALENKIKALEDKLGVEVGSYSYYSERHPNPGGISEYSVYGIRRAKEPVNEVVKLLLDYLKLELVTKPGEAAKKELVSVVTTTTTTDTVKYPWVEYGVTFSTGKKKKGKK